MKTIGGPGELGKAVWIKPLPPHDDMRRVARQIREKPIEPRLAPVSVVTPDMQGSGLLLHRIHSIT